jgi:hypothetical protein
VTETVGWAALSETPALLRVQCGLINNTGNAAENRARPERMHKEGKPSGVTREAARAVAERLLLEEDGARSIEATKQGTLAKLGTVKQ